MPLDLRHHSGLLPHLRLIVEAGVVASHLVRRSPDSTYNPNDRRPLRNNHNDPDQQFCIINNMP